MNKIFLGLAIDAVKVSTVMLLIVGAFILTKDYFDLSLHDYFQLGRH